MPSYYVCAHLGAVSFRPFVVGVGFFGLAGDETVAVASGSGGGIGIVHMGRWLAGGVLYKPISGKSQVRRPTTGGRW